MITETIQGVSIELETDPTLFSPRAVDRGTEQMLSFAAFRPNDKVLDLGCRYGVVGIIAAKLVNSPSQVFLLDSDPHAVELATENAARNQVSA